MSNNDKSTFSKVLNFIGNVIKFTFIISIIVIIIREITNNKEKYLNPLNYIIPIFFIIGILYGIPSLLN